MNRLVFLLCTILFSSLYMPIAFKTLSSIALRRVARQMSTSPPAGPPSAWLLTYKYVEGILDKRVPYREGHLGLANDLAAAGKMIAAGPLVDATGALFIFGTSQGQADAVQFVENDPYVKAGLVTSYEIKEWAVGVAPGNIGLPSKL